MKTRKLFVSIIVVTFLVTLSVCASVGKAKIKVKVTDEAGKVLTDAKVKVYFQYDRPKAPGQGWGTITVPDYKEGMTNKEGVFQAEGNTGKGIPIEVNLDGFYESNAGTSKLLTYDNLLRQWSPSPCEVTVKLRKIKDPKPMYVVSQSKNFEVPGRNKKFGYDLKAGDWVAPHGKGSTNDLYIKVTTKIDKNGLKHYIPSFSFTEKGDGMQEVELDKTCQSSFAWPYLAPENGFIQTMNMGNYAYGEAAYGLTVRKTKSYFILRTRTKFDDKGNIVSAHYTRLSNFIYANGSVRFTYHFNPYKTSRSLEFNGKNMLIDRTKKRRRR